MKESSIKIYKAGAYYRLSDEDEGVSRFEKAKVAVLLIRKFLSKISSKTKQT